MDKGSGRFWQGLGKGFGKTRATAQTGSDKVWASVWAGFRVQVRLQPRAQARV